MSKKDSSRKPLLIWVLLWILGVFLIGVRNDLTLMGRLSSFGEIIIAQLYINIINIPITLAFWFVMRFVLRKVGKSNVLEGKKSVRNTFIIWLVLFGLIFLSVF